MMPLNKYNRAATNKSIKCCVRRLLSILTSAFDNEISRYADFVNTLDNFVESIYLCDKNSNVTDFIK